VRGRARGGPLSPLSRGGHVSCGFAIATCGYHSSLLETIAVAVSYQNMVAPGRRTRGKLGRKLRSELLAD